MHEMVHVFLLTFSNPEKKTRFGILNIYVPSRCWRMEMLACACTEIVCSTLLLSCLVGSHGHSRCLADVYTRNLGRNNTGNDLSLIELFHIVCFLYITGNSVRLLGSKRENGRKLGGAALSLPKIRKNPLIEIIPINTGCLNQCTYCKTKHARGDLGSYSIGWFVMPLAFYLLLS